MRILDRNTHFRRCAVAVIGVAIGAAGCGRRGGAPPQGPAAQPGPPSIAVVQVVEQPLEATLTLPAELTAYESVAIYPRVTGFVKSIAVDRGSRVRTGQLLAVLEAPELASQRLEAQSKLQAAQAQAAAVQSKADAAGSTYDKLKAASATPGVVAGNDLVLAEKSVEAETSQLAAAQQGIETARQALNAVREMESYLKVTAPFDGVITERNIHPGALVGPSSGGASTPMLRVVEEQRLRLVVPVPEAYVGGVSPGAVLPFSVAAYPGQSFSGTVARIARAIDVQTRTMAVELDVANAEGRLVPGTFCQVRWTVRRTSPSLLVPSASVASTTGRTFVVRVRDGRAEWVDVSTGLSSGRMVEVFGPLHAGDEVALRGTDEIQAGTAVHATLVKPPAS